MAIQNKLIGIVLLAAGAASRFGGDKMHRILGGRRLVDWAVAAALGSELGPVYLVTRTNDCFENLPEGVKRVPNERWQSGLASSVKSGLHAATDCEAVIFVPADQPLITSEVYRRLAEQFHHGSQIVVASYAGQPRNPVLLGRSQWAAVAGLRGDTGLSIFVRSPSATLVECGTFSTVADIDTPQDLAVLEQRLASPLTTENQTS